MRQEVAAGWGELFNGDLQSPGLHFSPVSQSRVSVPCLEHCAKDLNQKMGAMIVLITVLFQTPGWTVTWATTSTVSAVTLRQIWRRMATPWIPKGKPSIWWVVESFPPVCLLLFVHKLGVSGWSLDTVGQIQALCVVKLMHACLSRFFCLRSTVVWCHSSLRRPR